MRKARPDLRQILAREREIYRDVPRGYDERGAEAARFAGEIEGPAAELYMALLEEARENGAVRADLDPGAFAMFFDNLLMMLHFTYSVDYYRERMELYKPARAEADRADRDEEIVRQMMLFIRGALGSPCAGITPEGGTE